MSTQTPEDIEKNFSDLDYTQEVRKRIVIGISDTAIKEKDPELLARTMQALDGMDKVSLGRLKLNEKAKENETRADEAAAMSQYLVTLSERRQRGENVQSEGTSTVAQQKLPEALRPKIDPSVLEASAGNETVSEFRSRMESSQ